MDDLVDPRRVGSEFDGIESHDTTQIPERCDRSEAEQKPANPGNIRQVDPRKEYREFDGIRSSR